MPVKNNQIRSINWMYLIPQLAVIYLLIMIFHFKGVKGYALLGVASYFLLSAYLKIIIPRFHRKGLFYFRKKEYMGAAYCFVKSYYFFKKYPWVDQYRAFMLLSTSAISYTEMALGNAAYSYRMAQKPEEATKYEAQLRKEYPNSDLLKKD